MEREWQTATFNVLNVLWVTEVIAVTLIHIPFYSY